MFNTIFGFGVKLLGMYFLAMGIIGLASALMALEVILRDTQGYSFGVTLSPLIQPIMSAIFGIIFIWISAKYIDPHSKSDDSCRAVDIFSMLLQLLGIYLISIGFFELIEGISGPFHQFENIYFRIGNICAKIMFLVFASLLIVKAKLIAKYLESMR